VPVLVQMNTHMKLTNSFPSPGLIKGVKFVEINVKINDIKYIHIIVAIFSSDAIVMNFLYCTVLYL
jgi:hypothetical protein